MKEVSLSREELLKTCQKTFLCPPKTTHEIMTTAIKPFPKAFTFVWQR
jgi:hypothetical protein